jgi:hypothetical protein
MSGPDRHRDPGRVVPANRSCKPKEDGRMARYGKTSKKTVEKALHKAKRGTLKSGRSGKTVKSRKQAIAIGLSKARKKGAKIPRKGSSKKK